MERVTSVARRTKLLFLAAVETFSHIHVHSDEWIAEWPLLCLSLSIGGEPLVIRAADQRFTHAHFHQDV